jgi:hypothetical protein
VAVGISHDGMTALGDVGDTPRGHAWDIVTRPHPRSAPEAPGAYRAPRRGRPPPGGRCGGGLPPPRGIEPQPRAAEKV